MSTQQLPKKKKKKKKKRQKDHLKTPTNSLSPTNHYEGTTNTPIGAPSFVGDDITNPTPRLIQHLLATKINLFKLDIAKREKIEMGTKVLCIIPQKNQTNVGCVTFSILIYESKNRRLILTLPIDNTFDFKILGAKSLSLADKKNGNLYSVHFMDGDIFYEFVCCCCLAKIFREDINTDNHRMIIQDLNTANDQPLQINCDTLCAHTLLKIWTANHREHPYKV